MIACCLPPTSFPTYVYMLAPRNRAEPVIITKDHRIPLDIAAPLADFG